MLLSCAAHAADPLVACTLDGRYWDVSHAQCRMRHIEKATKTPVPAPNCFWQKARAVLDDHTALNFRYQNCGRRIPYVIDRARGVIYNAHEGVAHPVVQFWPYQPGQLDSDIVTLSRLSLKPDEDLDCVLTYSDTWQGFAYTPSPEYSDDLRQQTSPGQTLTACGVYGVTDTAEQFFRILDDRMLVFFHLHNRREPLDPFSVTLETTP